MVAAAGAGPPPIPHKQLTSDSLVQAIRFCLTDEATLAAKDIAERIKSDHGSENAVDSFYRNLPVDALRCDLLPHQAAVWVYKKGAKSIKLSKVAAEVLVENVVIRYDQLKIYERSPITIENWRWDPLTATTSSLASTSKGMMTSTAAIITNPIMVFQDAARVRKQGDKLVDGAVGEAGPVSGSSGSTFGKAVAGSASGVGGFFHHLTKGMLLDMPLAATEGLRAVPALYGEGVKDHGTVKDWKSGMIVAGKNFAHGVVEGVSDLVNEPMKGAQRSGAVGGVKGMGKGMVNATTKVSSGMRAAA
jgi:hypothetical protein